MSTSTFTTESSTLRCPASSTPCGPGSSSLCYRAASTPCGPGSSTLCYRAASTPCGIFKYYCNGRSCDCARLINSLENDVLCLLLLNISFDN